MKKVLKATGSLVVVDQKKEEVTKSGIVISQSAVVGGSMEMFEGTVLCIGPKVTKFKKGDYVVFGRNVFSTHKRQGKEYLMIYEQYVACTELEVEDDKELGTDEMFLDGVVK